MKKIIVVLGIIVAAGIVIMSFQKQSSKEIIPKEKQEVMMKKESADAMSPSNTIKGKYIEYSKTAFEEESNNKRVYFFHATWCPTCKIANEEFMKNTEKIPDGVTLLKTDYDTEKELKMKYGITYQHTFVYVDSLGNEIEKWNGGGIEELIENTL